MRILNSEEFQMYVSPFVPFNKLCVPFALRSWCLYSYSKSGRPKACFAKCLSFTESEFHWWSPSRQTENEIHFICLLLLCIWHYFYLNILNSLCIRFSRISRISSEKLEKISKKKTRSFVVKVTFTIVICTPQAIKQSL